MVVLYNSVITMRVFYHFVNCWIIIFCVFVSFPFVFRVNQSNISWTVWIELDSR